ncbi:MAG: hypothetical protein LAP40_16930 [Acidobacteriia bacterium]|nr:hypothetical protein [Terriglobia bacterium]
MGAPAKRVCNVCRKRFPRTLKHWNKQPRRKDGLDETCKECAKKRAAEWYQANKERRRAEAKEFREDYRDDVREEKRESRLRNIEQVRAYQAKYNRENSARRVEYTAQWRRDHPKKAAQLRKSEYDNNKERIKQRARDWYRANRERALAQLAARRFQCRISSTVRRSSSFDLSTIR